MNIQVSRNEIMSTSTSVQQATPESVVICKHQPGEVWTKGCCTSRLCQSEAPSQEDAVHLETTSEEESEPDDLIEA